MKIVSYILLLVITSISLQAQQLELDRVVIGAASQSFDNNSDFVLDATIGEALVGTITTTDLIITEGFQQSNYILNNPLILELSVSNAACLGANDGEIYVNYVSPDLTTPITYNWSNNDTGSSISGLEIGMYTVTATGSNGKAITNQIEVLAELNEDCKPIFYTGITPNGDGKNDLAQIVGDKVQCDILEIIVFNRWGQELYRANGPNLDWKPVNKKDKELSPGVYYYLLRTSDAERNGSFTVVR